MIVVAGALAQRPARPGHAWVFLQYLLGFKRLGHEVLLLDRIPANARSAEAVAMVKWLESVMDWAGLGDAWSIAMPDGSYLGVSYADVAGRMRSSELLLDVNGVLNGDDMLGAAPKRVFLDIDPGFIQMWKALGLADVLSGHDMFVTVASRIGAAGCNIPTLGIDWTTVQPPVVLEHWPQTPLNRSGAFTSIATWRGPFGPVDFGGETYGLRVHEFRRFLALPGATGARFEVVLDIDPEDERDRIALREAGWHLRDPAFAVPTLGTYRDYITRSKAEICVAKSMYVQSRSGWFSDRSACYLATGRPVLAQETGFSESVPTGKGLISFDTIESAAAGIRMIEADLTTHSRAARRIAEEHFDSDIVLTRLLRELDQKARPVRPDANRVAERA
jgi:hypothetical protein